MTPARRAMLRLGPPQRGHRLYNTLTRQVSLVFPCGFCGAADSRDAEHQRGCPTLEQAPDAEVYRLQREVAAAWREKYWTERESREAARAVGA
jgi:hypothetical protein